MSGIQYYYINRENEIKKEIANVWELSGPETLINNYINNDNLFLNSKKVVFSLIN